MDCLLPMANNQAGLCPSIDKPTGYLRVSSNQPTNMTSRSSLPRKKHPAIATQQLTHVTSAPITKRTLAPQSRTNCSHPHSAIHTLNCNPPRKRGDQCGRRAKNEARDDREKDCLNKKSVLIVWTITFIGWFGVRKASCEVNYRVYAERCSNEKNTCPCCGRQRASLT